MADIEQRARELLAAEFDKEKYHYAAQFVRDGSYDKCDINIAVRVIAAALASQAQAGVHKGMADEYQAWIDFFHRGDGDYDDFLRSQVFATDTTPEGGSHG